MRRAMSAEPGLVTCPHHPACPGCPLLGLPYLDQLAHKRTLVARAFAPYAVFDERLPTGDTLPEVHAAPSIMGYRVRAKLVVDSTGLGLFERGGHAVVSTPGCVVLRPAVAGAVAVLRHLLPRCGQVSSLDVREVDDGVMVTLAVADPEASALSTLLDEVRSRVPGLVSLALSTREQAAPQVLGSAHRVIAGVSAARHTPDPTVPYHYAGSGAFTQAHPEQLSRLHRHVEAALRARLGPLSGQRLLELYAGTGALGLRLASRGAQVTLVEAFAPAMRLAAQAAVEQGLVIEARTGDAATVLRALQDRGAHYDAILVNPPRRGLSPEVRQGIARLTPRMLHYVSCEPRTLARDIAHLGRLGLVPCETAAYDMIPLSAAVETVAVLEPARVATPRVLYADERLIVVDKCPHERVTPGGEPLVSLLERVRDGLAPEATPIGELDPGVSGVCCFARSSSDADDLRLAFASAERTYTVLAKGITHKRGTISRPLREGRRQLFATTRYVRQRVIGGHSLLGVIPEREQRGQIPRHLASVGHSVVGSSRAGDPRTNQHFEHRHGLDRSFLHLAQVRLPYGDGVLELRSELAPDLAAVLESLEG